MKFTESASVPDPGRELWQAASESGLTSGQALAIIRAAGRLRKLGLEPAQLAEQLQNMEKLCALEVRARAATRTVSLNLHLGATRLMAIFDELKTRASPPAAGL